MESKLPCQVRGTSDWRLALQRGSATAIAALAVWEACMYWSVPLLALLCLAIIFWPIRHRARVDSDGLVLSWLIFKSRIPTADITGVSIEVLRGIWSRPMLRIKRRDGSSVEILGSERVVKTLAERIGKATARARVKPGEGNS